MAVDKRLMISGQDLSRIFRVIDEWPQLSRDQQIKFNELCIELDEAARGATSTLPPETREHIKKLVDAATPLTEQQRARLRLLLRPNPKSAAPLTRKALQEPYDSGRGTGHRSRRSSKTS